MKQPPAIAAVALALLAVASLDPVSDLLFLMGGIVVQDEVEGQLAGRVAVKLPIVTTSSAGGGIAPLSHSRSWIRQSATESNSPVCLTAHTYCDIANLTGFKRKEHYVGCAAIRTKMPSDEPAAVDSVGLFGHQISLCIVGCHTDMS